MNGPTRKTRPHAGFGRMFGAPASPLRLPLPTVLGAARGPMDQHELGHGNPGATLPEAEGWLDNPDIAAALTYLGQFIDHDISLDFSSRLGEPSDPWQIRNLRTRRLKLDGIYGRGPETDPQLYDRSRPGRLLVGGMVDEPLVRMDLPRDGRGVPVLGDPRNAENLIIAQLHVAFLRFHNAMLEWAKKGLGIGDVPFPETEFERTRRLVCWHYQWIVLKEFLPSVVDELLIEDVLDNSAAKLFAPGGPPEAWVPIEFSAAAFRFGHSQIQQGYSLDVNFKARVFPEDPDAPLWSDPSAPRLDLRYSPLSVADRINWNFLLPIRGRRPDGGMRLSSRINRKISAPLFKLPTSVMANLTHGWALDSLPARTLQRQVDFALPSGIGAAQEASRRGCVEVQPLSPKEIWAGEEFEPFAGCDVPLWFYVLAEAEHSLKTERRKPPSDPPRNRFDQRGQMLGPLGQRIVSEVIIGLLRSDPQSFINLKRDWISNHPEASGKDFNLARLLKIAKMLGA